MRCKPATGKPAAWILGAALLGADPVHGAAPQGWLDAANGSFIAGWAKDDDFPGSIPVHIYVDGGFVHALTADSFRLDVGQRAFHWVHPPFGAGDHSVVAYAIGVDAQGRPDGQNQGLSGSPKSFNVGCSGLVTNELEWCINNPNYWVHRQRDTKILMNGQVKIGINNSYGGMITQLYGQDTSRNLITEHGGGAVQLSIWGYDANGSSQGAFFGSESGRCDPAPYATEEECLRNNKRCRPWGMASGAHVADCRTFSPCLDWGAAAPWNPIQAQAENCGWDSPTNDVDASGSPEPGAWEIRLDDPYHFTKTDRFRGLTFKQKVRLGDIYARVDYTLEYRGPHTTGKHPQEIPAIFGAQGIGHHFYYAAGSSVRRLERSQLPAGGVFLGFPGRAEYGHGKPFDTLTEGWWTACDAGEGRCLTVATFSPAANEVALSTNDEGAAYITLLGFYGIQPGFRQEVRTFFFPYKYDALIGDRTVRKRISELEIGDDGQVPIGWLDGTDNNVVSGWALDPDTAQGPISVHLYFDGMAGSCGTGCRVVGVTANLPRPDVNRVTGHPGDHGFAIAIPQEFRDGRTHSVRAYGINTGRGINPELSGSPKEFPLRVTQAGSQP